MNGVCMPQPSKIVVLTKQVTELLNKIINQSIKAKHLCHARIQTKYLWPWQRANPMLSWESDGSQHQPLVNHAILPKHNIALLGVITIRLSNYFCRYNTNTDTFNKIQYANGSTVHHLSKCQLPTQTVMNIPDVLGISLPWLVIWCILMDLMCYFCTYDTWWWSMSPVQSN